MMKQVLIAPFIISVICLVSCNDRIENLPARYKVSQAEFSADGEIKDMIFPADSLWLVCGGKKNTHGFIYASHNKGASWQKCYNTENASINTLFYSDEAGFWAGGDSIRLWRSDDGISWYDNPRAPCYWDNCENPYYDLHVWNKHHVFAVGGEYFQRGITSESGSGVSYWIQLYWPNQWNDMVVDGYDVIIAGYGMVMQSTDTVETFEDMNVWKENFIALSKNQDNDLYLLAEQGKIYCLENKLWKTTCKLSGRFRDLAFYYRYGCAVGDDAVIGISEDNGNSWSQYQFPGDHHLSFINSTDEGFIIGSRSGNLYFLKMEN
ncbi:MAG: WD40/YVTN/BNR-like repeat-containing protein [Bacteroidales bacterium]